MLYHILEMRDVYGSIFKCISINLCCVIYIVLYLTVKGLIKSKERKKNLTVEGRIFNFFLEKEMRNKCFILPLTSLFFMIFLIC